MQIESESAELFRHLSADRTALYRCILDVFAAAKRQYRHQLCPDEVHAEARWPGGAPHIEEVHAALAQLAEWGNLESQHDTARVARLADFYRARFLYRLSHGGESVEAGLALFLQTLQRRAELQTVALEDIASRLQSLHLLLKDDAAADTVEVAKIHEILRDLVRVFESLAENAQAFMAGVARSIELQQAEAGAVLDYKRRLIDYLERFMGDLVRRSDTIARSLQALAPRIDAALQRVAQREARDAAPGDSRELHDEQLRRHRAWRERWQGLCRWFLPAGNAPPEAELLRARARAAIPQLLAAIATLKHRRSGRSDRSADFRVLAEWFAECGDDDAAHRLARAAFALNPARHFSLGTPDDESLPASVSWTEAPPLRINPRLREYGEAAPRGPLARVRDRSIERALMASQLAEESRQVDEARRRLATGRTSRLNELARPALFLNLPVRAPGHGLAADGEPGYLSLRRLLRSPPVFGVADREVFVCENPNLVAIAADRLGARCAPLVCTGGMPAAAQRTLLGQRAGSGADLRYHGDFDWAGLRIANRMIRTFGARPWRLRSGDYETAAKDAPQLRRDLADGPAVAAIWDATLAPAMQRRGVSVAEEAVAASLLDDLRR